VSVGDEDWAAIHPLGDMERFSKIRDLVDALMEPGFELAMNPSCEEVDTVDELIDTVNAWEASRRRT
jgi:hypothetical protein